MERLWRLVQDAKAEKTRPFEPGEESRPVTFITDHLAPEGWELGWRLVIAYREGHPELFLNYSQNSLHVESLELLEGAEQPLTVDELANTLKKKAAEDESAWLVDIPLANVKMASAWSPAGETAIVRRAWDVEWKPGQPRPRFTDEEGAGAEFAIYRHLRDRLPPPTRFYALEDDTVEDTKRTASIALIQRGTKEIAVEKAQAKAHYAVATWWVLSPGDWNERPPMLASWAPQPDQWADPAHKRYDPGEFISKERRYSAIHMYEPYTLPEEAVLAAPFTAFDALDRRCAQALLSSTATLYRCEVGSGLTLSERISEIARAVERLCESPDGESAWGRWDRLAARFEVWSGLERNRGYSPEHTRELKQRLRRARNIGTHGADAALLDLGWNAGDRRMKFGPPAVADDLALAALYRDLQPMVSAVALTLDAVWRAMLDAEFDDREFEKLFA